eukprot:TRINITY_DN5782_c0_g1_i14.p1 TRINITY_DN5782_c0_g1~~TRINITY_DN5782_c0_g1_i14.p1  ORF type:complete len:640 (+),score=99.30 TRINITY_DN5782_c0_g1_i14:126-2045(+)
MEELKALLASNPETTEIDLSDQYHCCNLSDLNEIDSLIPLLAQFPPLESLNLSDNNLKALPEALSQLESLHTLNISNNLFESLPSVVSVLQTLPALKQLNLALERNEEVELVLTSLPNLETLNNQEIANEESYESTIEEQPHTLDKTNDGIPELDEEPVLPFKGPWTNHEDDPIETPAVEKDSLAFEERPLKIEESRAANVYDRLKECGCFTNALLDKEYDERIANGLKEAMGLCTEVKRVKARHDIFDLAFNRMAREDNAEKEVWKIVQKEHSEIVQQFLGLLENYEGTKDKLQEKLKDMEEQFKRVQEELNNQIKEKEELKAKQSQLHKEIIILRSRPLATVSKNVEAKETSKPIINIASNKSDEPKILSTKYNQNLKEHKKSLITPRQLKDKAKTQTRVLTLKQLKELIHDIYIQKQKYDEKCAATKLPRETMEQYMYSYLNQRYGLKSLIIEWTAAIVSGIKAYYTKDCDVQLFWKILRNECDEDYRFTHGEAKITIIGILKEALKQRFRDAKESEIEKMANIVQGQSVEEWLWKEILRKMYSEEYAFCVEEHIREKILELQFKTPRTDRKGLTREELALLQCNKDWSIPFTEFQRVHLLAIIRLFFLISCVHMRTCCRSSWRYLKESIRTEMEY